MSPARSWSPQRFEIVGIANAIALCGDTDAQVCTSLHLFIRDARDSIVLHPLLLKTVRMYIAHGITARMKDMYVYAVLRNHARVSYKS